MRTPLSRAARPLLAVVAAGAAVIATTGVAAAAGGGGGPLAGRWTSVDSDESTQTLDITGSGNRAYAMVYVDDAATGACGGDPARLSGPGFVDGDDVLMVAALVCLPGGNVLRERLAVGFHHDTDSDTLVDDFGIVWHRTS